MAAHFPHFRETFLPLGIEAPVSLTGGAKHITRGGLILLLPWTRKPRFRVPRNVLDREYLGQWRFLGPTLEVLPFASTTNGQLSSGHR